MTMGLVSLIMIALLYITDNAVTSANQDEANGTGSRDYFIHVVPRTDVWILGSPALEP